MTTQAAARLPPGSASPASQLSAVINDGKPPKLELLADSVTPAGEQTHAPAHLLVVDDDLDGLGVVIASLRDYDFAVSTAQNGKEALAIANESRPDLILLDVSLPGWTASRC